MAALSPLSPFLSPHPFKLSSPTSSSFILFVARNPPSSSFSSSLHIAHHLIVSSSKRVEVGSVGDSAPSSCLDEELLRRVSAAKDADQAMDMIVEARGGVGGGEVGNEDHRAIIAAAIDRGNVELALSLFHAMRAGFGQGMSEKISSAERWTWARPDVQTCALLVQGLAASLRVSDAIRIITYVSGVGITSGEEVPFGMIVRCPTCMIAIAVAQPQQGIQVRTPSGTASTHKFATKTVELPAQEGERVTISLAAPSNVYREMGPLKLSAKAPGLGPGEPMCLTNHTSGQVSQLLRAPTKDRSFFLFNPSILFPALTLLATGDAVSGFIDPTLPRLVSVAAVASVTLGTAVNRVILPELSKLPQRTVDVVALKQQLLSQYDLLQTRIKDLRQAAEKEVWMLARMCQLDNKIVAVGEPSYRARRGRVKRVRESLENSLLARMELIESYAKISSMIEIEVEMDSDVLAAEAVSNAESIAEQIQQMMEIENLEERWRIQAEANDEVERLLNSQPASTELV